MNAALWVLAALVVLDLALVGALVWLRRSAPEPYRCPVCTAPCGRYDVSTSAVPIYEDGEFRGRGQLICRQCQAAGAGEMYDRLCQERHERFIEALRESGWEIIEFGPADDEGEEWKR